MACLSCPPPPCRPRLPPLAGPATPHAAKHHYPPPLTMSSARHGRGRAARPPRGRTWRGGVPYAISFAGCMMGASAVRATVSRSNFASPEARQAVAAWRRGWASLPQKERRGTLCEFFTRHLHGVGGGVAGVAGIDVVRYTFLKVPVCLAAWHVLTGIGASTRADARQRAGLGEVEWQPKLRPRASPVLDGVHGALWALIMNMRERMPLARTDLDGILMPLSKKKQLYHMLLAWYEARAADPTRPPLLVRRPSVKSFWHVLRRSEFKHVRFHRVVEMGRCPKCCFYNWKVLSVGAAHREMWSKLAAKHQWLQLAQKRVYAMDRAKAAFGYPEGELYHGHGCWLRVQRRPAPSVPLGCGGPEQGAQGNELAPYEGDEWFGAWGSQESRGAESGERRGGREPHL